MTDTTPDVQIRAPASGAGARWSGAGLRGARWSGARLREAALGLAVAVGLFAGARYGYDYWTTGRYLISTDDAYVDAHSAVISPKISGYIAEVLVNDNQTVQAGQVLARIDARDYQTALDRARANVAAAQASIDKLAQQIAQQKLGGRTGRARRLPRIRRRSSIRSRITSANRPRADRLRHGAAGAAGDSRHSRKAGRAGP